MNVYIFDVDYKNAEQEHNGWSYCGLVIIRPGLKIVQYDDMYKWSHSNCVRNNTGVNRV